MLGGIEKQGSWSHSSLDLSQWIRDETHGIEGCQWASIGEIISNEWDRVGSWKGLAREHEITKWVVGMLRRERSIWARGKQRERVAKNGIQYTKQTMVS